MTEIKDILENLGLKLRDDGDSYRTNAIYRGGTNPTSVKISKKDGSFIDFSGGERGSLTRLVSLILNIPEKEVTKAYTGAITFVRNQKPQLSFVNSMDFESIGTLVDNYKYLLGRGISVETQKLFGVKLALGGKMYRRVVIPIYDLTGKVIGISGRATDDETALKYKHLGIKGEWAYPLYINEKYVKSTKTVILVESVIDLFTLWELGIKNVICLFGTAISKGILREIIRLNPARVLIATNNEVENNSIGNQAAEKIKEKLSIFFDESVIKIALPFQKDFNKQTKEENLKWKEMYYGSN